MARAQLVACETRHEANQLAWLDPNAPQKQPLAEGSELELPLWLAQRLHERQHTELQMPRRYSEAYRRGLKADPSHMDLRSLCDYYFHIGATMSSLCAPHPPRPHPRQRGEFVHMRRRPRGRMDDDDLNSHLLKAFASRFHGLSVAALNAAVTLDVTAQTAKLTLCERQRALPHPPARRAAHPALAPALKLRFARSLRCGARRHAQLRELAQQQDQDRAVAAGGASEEAQEPQVTARSAADWAAAPSPRIQ